MVSRQLSLLVFCRGHMPRSSLPSLLLLMQHDLMSLRWVREADRVARLPVKEEHKKTEHLAGEAIAETHQVKSPWLYHTLIDRHRRTRPACLLRRASWPLLVFSTSDYLLDFPLFLISIFSVLFLHRVGR